MSSDLDSYELQTTALQLRVLSQSSRSDPEKTAFAVDAGLQEVESWPSEAQSAVAAYKVTSVLILTTDAMLISASRLILPPPEGLGKAMLISREIALAAIEMLEGHLDTAKARLDATEAQIETQDSSLPFWEGRLENIDVVRERLSQFEGGYSAFSRITCLWSNAVQPRKWDRKLVDELRAYRLGPAHWGFRQAASLVYWLDVGDVNQVNALIDEIEGYEALQEVLPRSRSRFWEELTVYYALQKNDPHRAIECFSRTEPDLTSCCRSLMAAHALTLALSGDTAGSLAKLDEIEARIRSLPTWFPRYVEEAEKISGIRAFAERASSLGI